MRPRPTPSPQPNGSPPESVSGLIERVTFHNEENGFAVLRVKARGHRDLVTVVGSLASVSAGEWLTAEGRWVQDREFGQQFRAELLKSSAPTTREGIEKYLGSGMVKGIGPHYAKRLVEKFGEGIFDVIESRSADLQSVEGIGPKRRQIIKAAWAEQKVVRAIMVFLHSQGVSTSRAVRIYKTYGEEAVEKVRANPYALAADIHGIGFKTADQIAQRIGIPFDSLLRACAGLNHVLDEAMTEGHCALPVELLKERALKLLQVTTNIVDAAFAKNIAESKLARETFAGDELVFLPNIQRAEAEIAQRIRALAAGPLHYPPIDFDKAVAWCAQRTGKELAPSQREALRQALTHRLLVITGGPGVGKTTLLNAVLKILIAKKVRCLLCAPTGRAARRLSEATDLEARTIHRLLEAQPGGRFGRHEGNPLECDLLVVDETSMVDVPLMSRLLRALPETAALLLVGDVDQLPSVGPGMVLRDIIDSRVAPVARLTEVFRQAAHSRIIINAHRINEGHMPETIPAEAESDFHFIEREEPDRVADTLVEVIKTRIQARFRLDPIRDAQVLCPMNRGTLGVRDLNLRLQNELNPARPGEPQVDKFGWQFRARDKVIQTQNDYDKDVFNGDIGQITKIDPDEREVTVRFDNRDVAYDFGEMDELMLAYAITIHRAQGSEFPAVIIPVATQQYLMLQRNLIYTGVTRGKKLVVLIGQKKALAIAVHHQRSDRRFSALLARLAAIEE